MAEATANATQEVTVASLFSGIPKETLKKVIAAVPGTRAERIPYERGQVIVLTPRNIPTLEEINADPTCVLDVVVDEDKELGRRLTMGQVLQMYVLQATEEELVDNGDHKVIPFGKGKIIKDLVESNGNTSYPTAIKLSETTAIMGVTERYINSSKKKDALRAAYEQWGEEWGFDIDVEPIPLIRLKKSTLDGSEIDHWKPVMRTLVEVEWTE